MKPFAALSFLLAVGAASPVEINNASPALSKRDTEIIYLANCERIVSCCDGPSHWSQILYYSNSKASQSNQAPETNNQCTVPGGNYAWWENGSKQCKFPTGVSFTSHIDSDAAGRPVGTWAGWGSNGFKNWNCYRDNGRQIFSVSGPEWASSCSSVYYCTPQ